MTRKMKAFYNSKAAALILQFMRFGIVGASNTLISLGVYWLCFYVLHLNYQISNLIAHIISVTNAYYWNNRFVFKSGSAGMKEHFKSYARVFISYSFTYLIGAGLLFMWVEKLGVSEGIAPMLNLLITIPLNFLLNKFWVFRKKT